MIGRIAITTMVLLLSYAGFLAYLAPASWPAIQHQWQENAVKAQHFLYDEDSLNDIILGTSLSARLVMDSLPAMTNLSFQGLSVFDGLAIVERRGIYPRRIFIEMNIITRPPDERFLYSITDPAFYYSKKVLPVLREENQPIGAIGKKIKPFIGYAIAGVKKVSKSPSKTTSSANAGVLVKMITIQSETHALLPKEDEMMLLFSRLKKKVDHLKKNGVKVVFFEMPINCQLANLPHPEALRHYFYRNFPRGQYDYMLPDDCEKYLTVDGIHLNQEEAKVFSSYFKTQGAP